MKKIFAISDIHGHFKEMLEALNESGFDIDNENHLLIVCGDSFDRGCENVSVYKYLKHLTSINRAIVLKGNHDNFLISFFENDQPYYNYFNYNNNGMCETIADFMEETRPFEIYCLLTRQEYSWDSWNKWVDITKKCVQKEYPELIEWLKGLPNYYETENYIFTHASLDLKCDNWREPKKPWEELHFDNGNFIKKLNNTLKTIVLGHFDTGDLREMHHLGSVDDHSILKTEDNKIFIDGCVVLTKKVNVLVLEDNLLEKEGE